MACKSCGEKKTPKDSCSFTKAVVEINNPETLTLLRKVVVPASLGDDETYPASVGKYCNVILAYEANEHVYIYSSDGIPTLISEGTPELDEIWKAIRDEESARTEADNAIWAEIEEIEMSSDVVDIVGTYAELQQYDTTHLKDNDIIKVLSDETHQNETAYYRWSTATDTFSYVGSEGPYYTESEVDALLSGKQDTLIAGTNIQIAADGKTISATDTTYTHFTGATSSTDGVQGLVPGPLAGDEDKYLKADGTWATVQTGGNYTAGDGIDISAQDVISATNTGKARVLTTDDYNYHGTGSTDDGIAFWLLSPGIYTLGENLKIYYSNSTNGTEDSGFAFIVTKDSVNGTVYTLFPDKTTRGAFRIQYSDSTGGSSNVSTVLMQTDVRDSLTSTEAYRPLSANQGKVLKDLIDGLVIKNAGAPTTSTVGTVGMLYEDTTNGKLYICTDITGGVYTWEEVGGSAGPTVVQTTGTSTTDVMSQNAVTNMVFADPATRNKIKIGNGTSESEGNDGIEIGHNAAATGAYQPIAIGVNAKADGNYSVAIGQSAEAMRSAVALGGGSAKAAYRGSVALGYGAVTSAIGEVNIGAGNTTEGYLNSSYRLLTGLYDPQTAHDAVNKEYIDGKILTNAGAPTTSTAGTVGQLLQDSTNGKLYICTDATNPYVWEEVGGASIATINSGDWSALWQ